MKNALILIFALGAITLGALCLLQSRSLSQQKEQLAALRSEAEQQSRELADLQSSHQLLEKQRQELLDQTSQLAAKVQSQLKAGNPQAASVETASTTAADQPKSANDKNPFGNFLAKMMEDPETKKMIREQQRTVLDQLYSPLIKQLGLQPDQAEQFKDLLADNMLKSAEKATSLFGTDSATNRTEMVAKLTEEQKSFDELVRGFLGESGYAQYKDYQLTAGERTQLNQFRQTMGSENALTDQQTDQLLAFMREEKQAVTAAGGMASFDGQDPASMQAMFTGEGIDKVLQNQEAIGKRVFERARGVLSESQLAAFGKFQANQLQMMRVGMSMARQFMSSDAKPGGTPNP
ncbi:MAG TPA: hypothetical protein VFZ59_03780 [Verrucomicrobiae bacterium]|nr:hypothetical protein [Verrucomicrobiae bacterium]